MASDASFAIVEAGPIAARTLARARRGSVVAVFERSAYLAFDDALVCVGAPGLGSGPLNALVASAEAMTALRASLAREDLVAGDGAALRVGAASLPFAHAAFWQPAPIAATLDAAVLARGIERVRRLARTFARHEGLAFLLTDAQGSHALECAGRAAMGAVESWLEGSDDRMPAPLAALIGLGPGLTPSGDDFVGGVLVALHAFGLHDRARQLATWLAPRLESATHPISVAHLRAAGEGFASDALHACLCAMAADKDPREPVARLAAIGHTSGFDALAGAVAVADTRAMRRRMPAA